MTTRTLARLLRSGIVPLVGLLLAIGLAGCRHEESARVSRCRGCNLVLVTFDALRADHLGCFGYERDTSPRLDGFAAEAHLFSDAMSQSGTTVPSFASLFSSRYPYVDRVIQYYPEFGLKASQLTLAEVLQAQGYRTAAVVGHEFVSSDFGMEQGFDLFDDEQSEYELAETTTDRAVAVLRALEEPFFLWVHFRPPHTPYQPDDRVFEQFHADDSTGPTVQHAPHEVVLLHFARTEAVEHYIHNGRRTEMTASMVRQYQAQYDGNIRRADAAFGRLLDFVDGSVLTRDTIWIVGADHGESMGEHQILDHNALYHGILHVPILVRLPSRTQAVHSHPVMNVDIYPTALRLLDIDLELDLRGRDLFQAERDPAFQFAEYEDVRAVKRGRHKLIQHHHRRRERAGEVLLFDVLDDPEEGSELSEALPRVRQELLDLVEPLGWGADAEASATLEKLRQLGYIE